MRYSIRNRLHIKAIGYAILLSLVMFFAGAPVFAEESVFEVGKIYVLNDNDNYIFKLLSKPDNNGWVKVKPLTERLRNYLGDQGYLNLSQFSFAFVKPGKD